MLESEAKNKWCPLVRFPIWGDGGPSGGNEPRGGSEANCIGSGCALWVDDTDYYNRQSLIDAGFPEEHLDEGGTAVMGHCGLIKA